jgi:hypothetical protein
MRSSDPEELARAGVERSSDAEKHSVMMKESSVRTRECRLQTMKRSVAAMKCPSGPMFGAPKIWRRQVGRRRRAEDLMSIKRNIDGAGRAEGVEQQSEGLGE